MPVENSDAIKVAIGGPNTSQQSKPNIRSFNKMIVSLEFLPTVCNLFSSRFID